MLVAEQILNQAIVNLERQGRRPKAINNVPFPHSVELRHTQNMLAMVKQFYSNFNNIKPMILSAYTRSRTDSIESDLQLELAELNEQNLSAAEATIATLTVVAGLTNTEAAKAWGAMSVKAVGVDLSAYMNYPEKEIAKMIDWNTRLIKDMNRSQIKLIRKIINDAVVGNWSREQLSSRLTDVLGRQQRNRAKLIASDQVGKLYGSIIRRYSLDSGIKQYRWQTRMDERVRPTHNAMNGRIGRWDRRDFVAELGGSGDASWKRKGSNLPMSHPLEEVACRCLGIPAFDSKRPKQQTSRVEEIIQQFETIS